MIILKSFVSPFCKKILLDRYSPKIPISWNFVDLVVRKNLLYNNLAGNVWYEINFIVVNIINKKAR